MTGYFYKDFSTEKRKYNKLLTIKQTFKGDSVFTERKCCLLRQSFALRKMLLSVSSSEQTTECNPRANLMIK